VCSRFVRVRAGACFCARQGARSEVWSFQMSDEKRRIAQKQARPEGLRGKCRHAALRNLARERPLPASRALPGAICRSNAECDETGTDPRERTPVPIQSEETERIDVVAHQQVLGLLVVVEHHLVGLATDAGLLVAAERGMRRV